MLVVLLVVLPTSIDLLIFDRGYVWCEGRASAKILYLQMYDLMANKNIGWVIDFLQSGEYWNASGPTGGATHQY